MKCMRVRLNGWGSFLAISFLLFTGLFCTWNQVGAQTGPGSAAQNGANLETSQTMTTRERDKNDEDECEDKGELVGGGGPQIAAPACTWTKVPRTDVQDFAALVDAKKAQADAERFQGLPPEGQGDGPSEDCNPEGGQ